MSTLFNAKRGGAEVTFDTPGDLIDSLPTDENLPTHSEIQIIDELFQQNHGTVQKFLMKTRSLLVLGLLFILLSLPQVDEVVKKFIPSTETSFYILIAVKALLFMSIYFILKNIYLVRKK